MIFSYLSIFISLTLCWTVEAGLASMQLQQSFLTAPPPRLYEATFQNPLPSANEITDEEKQQAVKEAFVFAWQGYRNHSWGFDENRPVSNTPVNTR